MKNRPRSTRRFRVLAATSALFATALVASLALSPALQADTIIGVAAIDAYAQSLPPLVVPQLPGQSVFLDANGHPFATFSTQDRVTVALTKVSPWITKALISAEDHTFWHNVGIDPRGIVRATLSNLMGNPVEGGSTLTQQYVKNLLEYSINAHAATIGTLTRKLREVVYARQLTRAYTKAQILEGYLNTVYFGANAYGVQAASERYFSTSASNLTLAQSALLVALVRSPSYYNPLVNPDVATQARNRVLDMMVANHDLPNSLAISTKEMPLGLKPSYPQTGCPVSKYPFYCTWVLNSLLNLPELGSTVAERQTVVDLGGLVVHTTLVPADQAALQNAASSRVSVTDRVGTALVSNPPGTGHVVAMATNRVYGIDVTKNQSEVNYATSPSPVGSTFKAFTLATALSAGVPLDTTLLAGPTYVSPTMHNPPVGYFSNAEPSSAYNISLAEATAGSVNTAFVQLEERVGVKNIAKMAHAMGLVSLPLSGPDAPAATEGSLTLGARGFSPLEMASAYATLASGGTYCTPVGVTSLTLADHRTLTIRPQCQRVLTPTVASEVTGLLRGVVQFGTGTAAYIPGYSVAGKTGTTQNFGSAWFIGYTHDLVTSSWVGDPRGTTFPLYNVDGVGEVFGGTIPAQNFASAMSVELPLAKAPATQSQSLPSLVVSPPTIPDLAGVSGRLAATRSRALGLVVRGPLPAVVASSLPPAGYALIPGSSISFIAKVAK